ncbi:MAG TPA: hypothetical protein H9823_12900, partial [Candidatus Rubneribacter avistercoris]|nr:hypothetical protein [Candidatus Rubneribacter avistercoris]
SKRQWMSHSPKGMRAFRIPNQKGLQPIVSCSPLFAGGFCYSPFSVPEGVGGAPSTQGATAGAPVGAGRAPFRIAVFFKTQFVR